MCGQREISDRTSAEIFGNEALNKNESDGVRFGLVDGAKQRKWTPAVPTVMNGEPAPAASANSRATSVTSVTLNAYS
jgi:hypothetical protein